MKHFVIFLRLVFPRHDDFSRSNVFDRNTAGYPLFLSFDSPFPSPERTHSAWFKTIRRCITSTDETVSPFRQHMFRPPTDVLHVSLKFPADITSSIQRRTMKETSNFNNAKKYKVWFVIIHKSIRDRTYGINCIRIRAFHSVQSRERAKKKLSLESLVQFRIVDSSLALIDD